MDPTIKNGKQKINQVKKREPWRPFGASVKEDQAHRFFEMTHSPFMLYNTKVKYSGIPAVTHRDGTCRHNTVTPEMNPVYYELLDEFEKLINKNFIDTYDEDVIEGIVIHMTDKEAIIDINAKSEGVISLNEFRYNPDLKVGDKVSEGDLILVLESSSRENKIEGETKIEIPVSKFSHRFVPATYSYQCGSDFGN